MHCVRAPEEVEATPGEDLMQEHGALERILLIYEEAARGIEAHEDLDLKVLPVFRAKLTPQ
jgi:hypothetical protein